MVWFVKNRFSVPITLYLDSRVNVIESRQEGYFRNWNRGLKFLGQSQLDFFGHKDAELSTSVTMVEDVVGVGLNCSILLTPHQDDILCFFVFLAGSEVTLNITKVMMISLNDYDVVFDGRVKSDYSN